jgi:arsenate reductase
MPGSPSSPRPGAPPILIFHNPACSKSRQALELIEAQGEPFHVVEYLVTPPDRFTLESLVSGLDAPPADLVRTSDPAFAELGIEPASLTTAAAVVDVLSAHPELLQRPVVVHGGRVVIARPSERVAEILG